MSEFPAHWDFKTIGDFASRVRTKNTGGECQDPMTISAIDGLVSQRDYFNKIVASKNTEGYTLLHKNDFAYNKSYSDGYPVGAVRRLKTKDRGIVSPLYICFELNREQIDLHFADYLFDSDWFVQAIYGIAKEGARSHGLLNIGIEEFFSASLPIPPLPEQKKIAEILLGLTRISETLKTKIQKSRNLFACLLDEQFSPANPARTSLLEDISEFITYGLTVRPKYIEKGFPMVSAGECKNGFIDFAKAKKISKSDFSQVRGKTIPSKGDLLITKTGTLGRVAVVPEGSPPFTITQNVALVRPKRAEVIPEYLAYYIMSPTCQREIRDKTSVLAIPDLQLGILGNFGIPIPSMDAQMDVHSRFDSIASAIAILGKKVDQIDCLKNSLANELLSGRKRVSV